MIQRIALSGLALVAVAALCAWAGYDYRDARAGREHAAAMVDAAKALERAMEAREAARAAVAAVGARTQAALQRALDAQRGQIKCPPSGDVRDAVLPGLADRVRDVRASGAAAASLAPLPAASAADR